MSILRQTVGRLVAHCGFTLAIVALAGCRRGQDSRGAPPAGTAVAAAGTPLPADSLIGFDWPVPSGWGQESIAFPLGFAPDLPYRGMEELRFAPGWAKPDQPDYWSYAMVWWLTEKPAFDAATIGAAMTKYFRGLSETVGGAKYKIDASRFRAELAGDSTSRRLTGRIYSMDAFKTGLPIVLNAVIEIRECVKAGRHAVTFMLSPRVPTDSDSVWRALRSTARAFACEPADRH